MKSFWLILAKKCWTSVSPTSFLVRRPYTPCSRSLNVNPSFLTPLSPLTLSSSMFPIFFLPLHHHFQPSTLRHVIFGLFLSLLCHFFILSFCPIYLLFENLLWFQKTTILLIWISFEHGYMHMLSLLSKHLSNPVTLCCLSPLSLISATEVSIPTILYVVLTPLTRFLSPDPFFLENSAK